MRENRTLTALACGEKRVYIFIANRELWKIFLKQAKKEGFALPAGKLRRPAYDSVIALNSDMSFNYVGYIGHIWFRADANGRLRKVDFAKYINGEKNFDCETPYGISRQ